MDILLKAIEFAIKRHGSQLRKRAAGAPLPYVIHPVEVASMIADHTNMGEEVVVAAILHDVVEDTSTTLAEIERAFGSTVAGLVGELTDPPYRDTADKHAGQLARAPALSFPAKIVKLADKTCNVRDLRVNPPAWRLASRIGYLDHAVEVVRALGFSPGLRLLERFDGEAALTRAALLEEKGRA